MNDRVLSSYFSIVRKFEEVKLKLKQNKIWPAGNALNILFSIFGYKYENAIINHNFYHFSSEAWILTVFRQLKEKLIAQGQINFNNFSFNEILESRARLRLHQLAKSAWIICRGEM